MRLKEQMRERLRSQGKAKATYETYWYWCEKFLRFSREGEQWIHPTELREAAVERWLNHMANVEHCSDSTQNLALQSLCYLYREVLGIPLEGVSALRAKRSQRVPSVLDVSEVARLLAELRGLPLLVAQLIYGCGLRIGDVASLRIKDISFERCQLHIHAGKGKKDRYTSFPEVLHAGVRAQIDSSRILWRDDETQNPNGVSLPDNFRKKSPRAARQIGWYYLFCSDTLSRDDDGRLCRHHRDTSHLSREIKFASERAGIEKRVTSHILRHCYATHASEQGVDMRVLQQLLGHTDIRTTEIYVHANKDRATAAVSPLASLLANPQPTIDQRRHAAAAPQRPHKLRIFAG